MKVFLLWKDPGLVSDCSLKSYKMFNILKFLLRYVKSSTHYESMNGVF